MSDLAQFIGNIGWLAVRCDDPTEVAASLGFDELAPVSWNQGVAGARAGKAVFVSAPIDGWVFVVGYWVMDQRPEQQEELVVQLSASFGEAQLYSLYESIDHYMFMRAIDNVLRRSFGRTSEGETRDHGDAAPVEPPRGQTPNQDELSLLAGFWGIDPATLTVDQVGGDERHRAAPVPTSLAGELVHDTLGPQTLLEAGPANSTKEADLWFESARCPSCDHWLENPTGRVALPWERFAYEIAATCNGCGGRTAVRFAAGPGWETRPDDTDVAFTNWPQPSTLVTAEALESMVEAELENLELLEDLDDDEVDEEEISLFAKRALGGLLELEKYEPAPARVQDPRHETLKTELRAKVGSG